jgi:hypothetical protein
MRLELKTRNRNMCRAKQSVTELQSPAGKQKTAEKFVLSNIKANGELTEQTKRKMVDATYV